MKNKIVVITICFLLLIICLIVSIPNPKKARYQEHLERKKSKEKIEIDKIGLNTYQSLTVTKDNIKTHLPIMEITTKEPIPIADKVNKDTVSGSIKISSENEEVNTLANIRYRGNISLKFVKKGYNLKLIDNKGKDNKQEILGMSKNDEWVLHGPYIDKTLIRNYMWYNIVGQIMEYSPGCRYVELFVNNQYQGLYLFVEKINVSEYGRLKIEPLKENSKTSSFLIEQTQKNTSIEGAKNCLNNFSHYTLIEEQTTEF